jgi:hypothetical protein
MARGWESKAVEAQMEARERPARLRPHLSADEQERREKRTALELSCTRVRCELGAARSEAHRRGLEEALAFLEAALDELGA